MKTALIYQAETVILGNNNLICLNCKGTFTLQLPMKVVELIRVVNAFTELHKNCKPDADPE